MAEFAVVKFSLLAVSDTRQTGILREAEGGLPSGESPEGSPEELIEGPVEEPLGGSARRASLSVLFALAWLVFSRVQEAVRAGGPVGCVERGQFAVG